MGLIIFKKEAFKIWFQSPVLNSGFKGSIQRGYSKAGLQKPVFKTGLQKPVFKKSVFKGRLDYQASFAPFKPPRFMP